MKKNSMRLLGLLLAAVMMVSLFGLMVFAEGSEKVAKIGDTEYATLKEAINAAQAGDTVILLADVNEEVTISKNLTIDGADKTFTGTMTMNGAKGGVIENVNFGYNPDKIVLKNINLYAKPGQKIAFVGSTGAGKTTVTNLLNRFYDIQEGEIIIDGHNIQEYTKDSLRSNIAMVLQDTHLFTGTVMENIRYGRLDATDEEVIEAAKVASAHSFIMRLSDGYNTMLTGDGSNLSQGQRQLLNIARAAISKAPILVLDEATSSVDTRTERHIEHGMERLMKNRTTFVIAHRLSTVRNANAIMVLENGEIIERGTHEQLLEQKGRYYALYTGAIELD